MPGNEPIYTRLIRHVFESNHVAGTDRVDFSRDELSAAAESLGIPTPRNLGDIVYSFRYRSELPDDILNLAPAGKSWVIMPSGIAQYSFVAVKTAFIEPNPALATTKIPDATPGMITKYALSDEQALLARLRYNRLIDIFTGVASYSLQNHLRTTVQGMGQVETDEIYAGIDRRGAHYVFPVQAKGGTDKLSVVQIAQDFELSTEKFPDLIARPIAAQFLEQDEIALFEFEREGMEVRVANERHYKLVAPDVVDADTLRRYARRSDSD